MRKSRYFSYTIPLYIIQKMKIEIKILILFFTLSFITNQSFSQEKETKKSIIEKSIFPKAIGIINDYGKVFTEVQKTELTKILYAYNIETTRQVVVVTVNSIKPFNEIQKYTTGLGNKWGVGTAEKNNGLTIVVCNPCRKIGIATGTGTELILTDKVCNEIIEKTIIPEFRNGEFFIGIKNGVNELIKKWN